MAFALLMVGMLVAGIATGKTVAGVAFEDQIRSDDALLQLNGAGVRSMFIIKAYAIGLYVPRKANDANQCIHQAGPKRLRIVPLRDVGVSMFLSGLQGGLEKNLALGDLNALQPRLALFNAAIKSIDQLPEGVALNIDLTADDRTRLSLDGKQIGQDIPGVDFYQALLQVWLGKKPAQEELKASLLGR
jgi:hypothetical protein